MKVGKIVAVTGGIGAGKSVVCSILTDMGYAVYDCDSRAKRIMDEDPCIRELLIKNITPYAVDEAGAIDRKAISEVVFNNPEKLKVLNSIVHGAVREDLIRWTDNCHEISFVETAILYQSGIDKLVDEVWETFAPLEVRVARVCKRNGITPDDVLRRISSQNIVIDNPHYNTKIIINDDHHSLLLRIKELLNLS